MKITLNLKNILIYSEATNKYFFAEFKEKLNVIYGKNTAGKSTLIQLILYAFGINDNKIKLSEILAEEIFVRLECTVKKGDLIERYIFLRKDETLLIKDDNNKILRFNGIGGDQSVEHIKLKKYFNKLFNFTLLLESKSGITEAPIETIFLPYYVSQDVGWVYLRKSFSNLEFYKNFKEDFLDYYLGIENVVDRKKKKEIENEINRLQQQIKFFTDIERKNIDFEVSKIIDESLTGKANELIEDIASKKNNLLELERDYIKESNKLSFYLQRSSVVSKVKRHHKNQVPGKDYCPTCNQVLPENIENIYKFLQEENDTVSIQSKLNGQIKKSQSKVNSLNKKIESIRGELKSDYNVFNQYSENEVTIENWIDNKANVRLYNDLVKQIGELKLKYEEKKNEIKNYKTDEEILLERGKKGKIFKTKYFDNNFSLGLPEFEEERFKNLYNISSFPFQGVQLHLSVLSYHFAFNYLLTKTADIHRLPFILDSIFKEDIDGKNKKIILNFINTNFPKDTQTILSIADDKNVDSKIDDYSKNIFKANAHLICIGDGINKKALLKDNDKSKDELIQNSYEIMETV